ncbi:MAG TPA: 2-C-methyl-D-erythritol 4-phosphate cytidylyltransferase [Solirubrobacterales bacterium]|nr:2-C-methyl-D-erythritol 4-phosphate cytidylyltransferase [Solirubrobacterales bacterium]
MASSKSASPPLRPPSAPAVTAVIAAAGSGERLGAGGPKAFVPVAGRPMIEWSIEAFRGCGCVRSIVVAAPPGHVGDVAPGHDLEVVAGGATRAQSVANALAAVGTGYVAIHDAARPLLTPELVEALVAVLDGAPEAAGVIAAAPVVDTIKRAGDANLAIERTEDRSQLWAAQTPQVFRTEALREALAAAERPEAATDEAMLVEGAGGTVLIHPVEGQNLKVTTPLDLRVAALLLAERAGA